MNNKITITEMMEAVKILKAQGEKFTTLGIGPMSKPLIKAVLAKENVEYSPFPDRAMSPAHACIYTPTQPQSNV